MLRYLLDTDHLTLLEQGQPALTGRLTVQPADAVGTSAVSVEEALRGRLAYLARRLDGPSRVRGYGLLTGTVALLQSMPIAPFDPAAEAEYQRLRAAGLRVGAQDLKIAAVALSNRCTLLTRNRRDFVGVAGLVLDDWST